MKGGTKWFGLVVCVLLFSGAFFEIIGGNSMSNRSEGNIARLVIERGIPTARFECRDAAKNNLINVEIVKPKKGYFYINDREIFPTGITFIIGRITVEVEATTDNQIKKVEFYIDNKLKGVDYSSPHKWIWNEKLSFKHEIKVVAFDENENFNDAELTVWIFNGGPSYITKEKAIEILIDEVIDPSNLTHILYAFTLDEPLQEGDRIAPWLPDPVPAYVDIFPYLVYTEIEKPTWFFWIDDLPYAKYAHPNRFVFIDAQTGDIVIQDEQWWAVLNDVSLWNSSEDYWNPENWAFTNDDWSLKHESAKFETITRELSNSPGKEGAIVINGWSKGQTVGDDMAADAIRMGLFWATYPGFDTVKVNPPDNQQSDVEDAFDDTGDNDDVVVYITAHGGIDSSGEPFISCGGEKVTEKELCEMAKKHPNTTYKWIIDCCHSGAFIESLKELDNSAKIITSCKKEEKAYGDWDPSWDPNKDDWGSEFTSGFVDDLWDAWLANPSIDIIELLDKAFKTAVAKDACAMKGYTHPQLWEKEDRDPPIVLIVYPENNTIVFVPHINITGWIVDTVSGIVYVEYLWEWENGSTGGYETIDPPEYNISFRIEIMALQSGWNRVTVGAEDAAGNYGSASVTIFYEEEEDITPPVTTKEIGQPNWEEGYFVSYYTPIWLNATDDLSGVDYIYYETWWDSDNDSAIDTLMLSEIVEGNTVEIQFQYSEIFYGTAELRWYAVDNAGNEEEMHYQKHYVISD
jgi:hypothetical protein